MMKKSGAMKHMAPPPRAISIPSTGGTAPEAATITPSPSAAATRPPLSARYICGDIECERPAAMRRAWISFGSDLGRSFWVTSAICCVIGPTMRSFTLRRVSISRWSRVP